MVRPNFSYQVIFLFPILFTLCRGFQLNGDDEDDSRSWEDDWKDEQDEQENRDSQDDEGRDWRDDDWEGPSDD